MTRLRRQRLTRRPTWTLTPASARCADNFAQRVGCRPTCGVISLLYHANYYTRYCPRHVVKRRQQCPPAVACTKVGAHASCLSSYSTSSMMDKGPTLTQAWTVCSAGHEVHHHPGLPEHPGRPCAACGGLLALCLLQVRPISRPVPVSMQITCVRRIRIIISVRQHPMQSISLAAICAGGPATNSVPVS